MELPLWVYPLLLVTGLLAGFVDAIAGGGGLITLPTLLSVGLPPQLALGTNKLQGTFGSASAAWHFGRARLIDFRASAAGVLYTLLGAVAGAWLVGVLPVGLLRQVVPWLLVGLCLYMLVQPGLGVVDKQARMSRPAFHLAMGLALGFYDGFFGPGTGTFWALAYVGLLGFNLTRATAHTKLMNFTSNAGSLVVFALVGQLHVAAGVCMGLGQLLGARLGSGLVIRRGVALIRPVLVAVSLAITARLLWLDFAAR